MKSSFDEKSPLIYYGEEIGMRDRLIETIDEVQDPRGKLDWAEYKGRDGARHFRH